MADRIVEVFDLVRQYAELQGWIPIGRRELTVGDWTIKVNGTGGEWEGVPGYHALVENKTYIGMMLMHPMAGSVGGYQNTEADFVRDMKAELERLRQASTQTPGGGE